MNNGKTDLDDDELNKSMCSEEDSFDNHFEKNSLGSSSSSIDETLEI